MTAAAARSKGDFVPALMIWGVLAVGVYGIDRSLWLDEAWVANSVREPTLAGMFYYPEWLQTTPPLFLLAARLLTKIFGFSEFSLRSLPLFLTLLALAAMWTAARRVLSFPLVVLATVAVSFYPLVTEYSQTFKQYSGEVAATAWLLAAVIAYLEEPTRQRYWLLVGAVVVGMGASYSFVFLVPGVVLAVMFQDRARGAILATISAAVLTMLYFVFIRLNYSPELRAFWMASEEVRVGWSLIAAGVIVLAAVGQAHTIKKRQRRPLRPPVESNESPSRRAGSPPQPEGLPHTVTLVCALPCVLLAISYAVRWYPMSPRSRLFVLPCFVLLAATLAERVYQWAGKKFEWRWAMDWVIFSAAALLVLNAGWRQYKGERGQPEENFAGAMKYLREHVKRGDLFFVHAANREGFRAYASMKGWSGPQPVFGNTGYPCCARGKNTAPGSSKLADVNADLESKMPKGYTGKVWLFFTTRPAHWRYTGLNEGEAWRKYLWEGGCPPESYVALPNLAVSAMQCKNFQPGKLKPGK